MASSIAALAALLYASYAIALPQPLFPKEIASYAARVTYYQPPLTFSGTASVNGSCGTKVAAGGLNTTTCYTMHTDAIGIAQSTTECVFKVWTDVSDCSGNGSWTSYAIPIGEETTCIENRVLDGGEFTHKSGMLTCS